LLDQTIELLDRYEEAHWSRRLGKAKKRIENRDFSGLTYLLNAYGGMGSLNDLGIHPLNGHKIDDNEVTAVNNKLDKLRGRMFEVADQIRREVLKE